MSNVNEHKSYRGFDMNHAAQGQAIENAPRHIDAIIDEMRCQIARNSEARERISQGLERLGAVSIPVPVSSSCVSGGGTKSDRQPTAIETLHNLTTTMRADADDCHELANRLDRVV